MPMVDRECKTSTMSSSSRKEKLTTYKDPPKDSIITWVIFTVVMIATALYYLHCFATFLVGVVVLPFLAIFVSILQFGRFLLELYIRRTKNCMLVREDDAVWQQDCPSNRHIIHALMLIEGSPNLEKLREITAERLVWATNENGERICARLTQIITTHLGHFTWEEDVNFDIENHVLHWEGRLPTSRDELEQVLSEVCSQPLPTRNLSPWQFVIIPTALDRNIFAFLLRIHHSMADGVALTRIFVMNLYDNPPQGQEPKKFTTQQRLFMWAKAALVGPLMVIEKLFATCDRSLVHGQELCGEKVVSWSKDMSLALVKQIKNSTGTTVNDVMVSCIAGGLHDYLKDNGISKPDDMWASVPVDIRASRKSLKFKNKFALVFLRLPVVASDCLERLFITKHRMDIIKKSAEPLVTATTVKLLMMLPEFISKPLIDFFSSKMSCVLSNVPGPQNLLSIGGQTIVEGIFWPPQRANIGIGFSIFSYGGGIRIGVYADKSVLAEPRAVTKSIERHYEALVDTLNVNENEN